MGRRADGPVATPARLVASGGRRRAGPVRRSSTTFGRASTTTSTPPARSPRSTTRRAAVRPATTSEPQPTCSAIVALTHVETIGERRLRLAVLARQGLLERSGDSVPTVLSRTAGLQSQYAPSAYIGLWSRLDGFAPRRPHGRARLPRRGAGHDGSGNPARRLGRRLLADQPRRSRHSSGVVPRREAIAAQRLPRGRGNADPVRAGRERRRAAAPPPRRCGRQGARAVRRTVDRPRPGAAVRNVGSPAGESVRGRRRLGGPRARDVVGRRARPPGAPLPDRLRAGVVQRSRVVLLDERREHPVGGRPRRHEVVPGRGRYAAVRPRRAAAARRRRPATALPRDVGGAALGARSTSAAPAGRGSQADLPNHAAAIAADIPRRRPGGRHVEVRRRAHRPRPLATGPGALAGDVEMRRWNASPNSIAERRHRTETCLCQPDS